MRLSEFVSAGKFMRNRGAAGKAQRNEMALNQSQRIRHEQSKRKGMEYPQLQQLSETGTSNDYN